MKSCFLAFLTSVLMSISSTVFAVEVDTFRGPVSLEQTPKSVVAFPVGVIDTLDALGVSVEGVPEGLFLNYVDTSKSEKVGTLFTADIEKIHAMNPDLVIVGERSALQYDALAKIAPVIDLSIPRGNTFQAALARMHSLAKLFNKENKAQEVEKELFTLRDQVKQLINPDETVMVVMLLGRSLNALSKTTRIDWFETELGMKLDADEVKSIKEVAPISYEYILAQNPDWLIVMDRNASVGISAKDMSQAIMDTPLIHATKAWKNNHIIYLNGMGTLNAVGGVQGMKQTLKDLITAFSVEKKDK